MLSHLQHNPLYYLRHALPTLACIWILLLRKADSRQCIVCDSTTNAGCEDPFHRNEQIHETRCTSGWCEKLKSRTHKGDLFIVRTCSPTTHAREGCVEEVLESVELGRIPFYRCRCREDLCNRGATAATTGPAALLLLLVAATAAAHRLLTGAMWGWPPSLPPHRTL